MKKSSVLLALAAATAIGAGATVVLAESNDDGPRQDGESREEGMSELRLLDAASLSLTEAIAAAESTAGGRAIDAELEDEDGMSVFEVTVITADGAERELLVDITDGTVTEASGQDGEVDRDDN